MQEVTTTTVTFPSTSRDVLSEILREGKLQMLTTAMEAEVAEWIEAHRGSHARSSAVGCTSWQRTKSDAGSHSRRSR